MFLPLSEQDNYISLEYKLPPFLELKILQRTIKSLLKHEIEDSSREDYDGKSLQQRESLHRQ